MARTSGVPHRPDIGRAYGRPPEDVRGAAANVIRPEPGAAGRRPEARGGRPGRHDSIAKGELRYRAASSASSRSMSSTGIGRASR
ncbi:hypothetical protein LX16_4766 [Stackebrandtia albiflava]|uniref:Uncharacterized protein n=1 Tax=Stackebrandtia albiflava TaxID=406432 RepID=A0A562UQT3_9ACTN|nr:hypothetical protein LX16_4766 [Stackebrandtia albiflava]